MFFYSFIFCYIQPTGPNKELSSVRLRGNPDILKKEPEIISKTKGPNSQISKTTYPDPRGQNAAKKLSEENIDDILKSNEEFGYKLSYFSPVAQLQAAQ